jgi:hypothetical protein
MHQHQAFVRWRVQWSSTGVFHRQCRHYSAVHFSKGGNLGLDNIICQGAGVGAFAWSISEYPYHIIKSLSYSMYVELMEPSTSFIRIIRYRHGYMHSQNNAQPEVS